MDELQDRAPSIPAILETFNMLTCLSGSAKDHLYADTCLAPRDLRNALAATPFVTVAQAAEQPGSGYDTAGRLSLYLGWLAARGDTAPDAFAGWFNVGTIYTRMGDHPAAVEAFRRSLLLKPGFHDAAVNLGLSLEASGQPDSALRVWGSTLQADAARTSLLNHQGRLLEQLGRLDEAERLLGLSLQTDPEQPDVIQHWVHLRQKMCRWPLLPLQNARLSPDRLLAGAGPLGILALTDDVERQTATCQDWILRRMPAPARRDAPPGPYQHQRLRIGYLSSDFCRHAMSYLIAELFERHDRTSFEIYGYCSTKDDNSAIRHRILSAFDHVRLVRTLDDAAVARRIRDDEIDILIDLNGLTAGSRLQVLRWKPAPVQATYLGFVGPVPLPELDGLLCDAQTIPAAQAAYYQPTPVRIEGVFQANDGQRGIAERPSRRQLGLPDDGFVFCCFCGHFKVTQIMMSTWMMILRETPGSVLWLADDNIWSRTAFETAASDAGIDPTRIVFAARCSPDAYMARLGVADLFLDTFPYNAGTVASDAIRMGLPILTMSGRAFASRMAASLLRFYGALDGIATDLEDYARRAILFATDPAAYLRYKSSFTEKRWTSTIGDVQRFTRSFEATLTAMSTNANAVQAGVAVERHLPDFQHVG